MTKLVNRRVWLTTSGAGLVMAAMPIRSARAEDAPPPRPSIEVFARSARIANIALSPDGKRVAAISRHGDDALLLYFDVANSQINRLNMGPARVHDIFWGDNDHVVVVSSSTAIIPGFVGYKNEFFSANVVDLAAQKVKRLFDGEQNFYGIVTDAPQRVKTDGEYRIVAPNYDTRTETGHPLCLYSFGMNSAHGHLVLEGDPDTCKFVVTGDGQVAAYANFEEHTQTWELFFNTALEKKGQSFKKVYHLTGQRLDLPELVGLGRDEKSVLLFIDHNYREIGADGVLSEPLDTIVSGTQHGPLFHPNTNQLVGFSRHDDWISLNYFDPLLKKLNDAMPKVVGDETRYMISSFADDPRKMIVYTEDKGDAGSYWFCDLSVGQLDPITVNYPDLPDAWITQKQAIDYKAADGLNIHAYLTLPPFRDAKNLPLIVLPHGGPEDRDYIDFDWKTQALASQGYAVLQPNFRGSTGYGQDFIDAGHGEWGRKMQTDLSDGVRYLAGKGIVDPKRVAVFGASYGGYAALAGATLDPGLYRCAVSVAGVSDLKAMIDFEMQNSVINNSSRVMYLKRFLGDPKTYGDLSPAQQANKCDCPVMLVHGTDDTVVPIDQSQRMERALKSAGKDVEFITYKGQDHWEDLPSSRVAMMQAIVDFLQKHNPA